MMPARLWPYSPDNALVAFLWERLARLGAADRGIG